MCQPAEVSLFPFPSGAMETVEPQRNGGILKSQKGKNHGWESPLWGIFYFFHYILEFSKFSERSMGYLCN
jgi:hypothetical protein